MSAQPDAAVAGVRDVAARRRARGRTRDDELLREALAVARLGIFSYDSMTDRFRCSDEHADLLGLPRNRTFSAQELADVIHPDDRDPFVAATVEAMERREPSRAECRIVRPDGEVRWVQSRCSPIVDASGEVVGLHGTTQDVTDQKQTEMALLAQEERLREAQAVAHLGSWTWTVDQVHSEWSDEMHRIHGLEPDGSPPTLEDYLDFVHPDDREEVLSALGWTLHGRRPYDLEYRVTRPDGNERWVHARGRPVLGSDGVVAAVHGTILDITGRKRMELALAESEARLREAQAVGHVGSWEWDPVADAAGFSEESCRIFGIGPGDAPSDFAAFLERVHPGDRDGVVETMEHVVATGEEFEGDFRVVRPDGEIRWLFARGRGRATRSGRPGMLLGTLQDITERHEEEERYRAISELISDVAYAFRVRDDETEPERMVEPEWITTAFARLAGHPDEEAIDLLRRWRDLVHPDDQHTVERSIANALAGNEDVCEYRLVTRTGDTRWIQAFGHPIVDDVTGKVTRIYGAARDITEQRRVEQALREAYERERDAAEQLRAADRLKDEFLSTASHELRTPLTSIVGFASALSKHGENLDPEMQGELTEKLERNALELGTMVERLLDFSRLQAGTVDLDLRSLRLRPLIDQCIEAHVPAALSDHQVEVDVPEDLAVLADSSGVIHVVTNLLTNAAKYSPESSRIFVCAQPVAGDVEISVHDEGVGIEPEAQERIFDRFVRGVDQPAGIRGSGIGLAIARSYVELMGGRIGVTSEPGEGSVFSFTLPVATSEAADRQ